MGKAVEVILRKQDEIGLMEIKNPPENYFQRPDFIEIEKLNQFVESGIKALVISGYGRHFSAGASLDDINTQISNKNVFVEQMMKGNQLLNFIDEIEIPVIAAISGVCFGAGLEIALASDIRYCDEKSLFAFPEINHDLIPGLSGINRLIKLIGKQKAIEIVLHGDLINAEKAIELKIVDEIVIGKKIKDHAFSIAQLMTNNRSLKVIRAIMRSVKNHEKLDNNQAIIEDARMFAKLAEDSFDKN